MTQQHRTNRLPLYQLLAYCSLTFPIVAVGMPVTTFLPPLYASQGGLGLATIGLIFMIARVWDVISDPIVGVLVDRYQWRRGRRKIWVAVSLPLLCVTALFLFMPERGSQANAVLLLVELLLLYTGWTFLQTAHQAWGADLTPGYDERSRLYGVREMVNVAGSIFILALPGIVGIWMNVDEYTEVAVMGWFLIVMLPITMIVSFILVPDHSTAAATKQPPPVRLRDIISSLNNLSLWRVLMIEIATGIGIGVTSATFLFVARGIVGFQNGASTVLLIFFLAAIAGIPVWLWFSKRFEKHTALQISCLYSLAGNLLMIPVLIFGNTAAFVVMIGVMGLSFGAPQALLRSMMADQVDREEVESGQNKAGFYFAFMNTAYKLGQASAIAISFFLLAVIGFDPENVTDPSHHLGLIMVFTLLPMLIFAICALLCRNYPLTRRAHAKDRERLDAAKPAPAAQEN